MTHPITPREKPLGQIAYDGWAQGLPGCEWDNQTETQKRAWSKAADAVLTALASGSGDHAELIEDAMDALQIIDAFPSNQGEVEGRITEKGDRMLSSCTRDVRRALEALLAENAALRAENTEAERKLAEAVRLLRRIDRTYADMQDGNGNHPTELRKVRTFLSSKEAERG